MSSVETTPLTTAQKLANIEAEIDSLWDTIEEASRTMKTPLEMRVRMIKLQMTEAELKIKIKMSEAGDPSQKTISELEDLFSLIERAKSSIEKYEI